MGKTVKAAVLTAPGRIELQEFPYPTLEEGALLLLRVEMCGICGTDKHTYQGQQARRLPQDSYITKLKGKE